MRAINHALTGALLGFSIGEPLLAVPLAVLSHFVCDAIPHFGGRSDDLASAWFRHLLLADAVACLLLVAFLAALQPEHWLVAAVSAFAATAPDLMWIPRYVRSRRRQAEPQARHWLLRFHGYIQWFERPIGLIVEIVWGLGAGLLLMQYIR